MFRPASQRQAAPAKRKMPNKLIAAFAALSATAVITASGFAAAATPGKPTKEQCKQAGYTNYGQCVKDWAHAKAHPGNGYGGNTSVVTNIDLNIENSNDNIIQVIVNVFR
jgi:hypothetical protein